MWYLVILMLSFSCAFGYTSVEKNDTPSGVKWPSEYYLKGETVDLSLGIKKPFEIWYSANLNQSRISFYDRLDTIFYYGDTGKNGSGYKYSIFPTSLPDLNETTICVPEVFTKKIKGFLPSSINFTYSDRIMDNNKKISVWKSYERDEGVTKEHILYVYRHRGCGHDVPVRYELKQYSEWTRALSSHEITEFYNFKPPDSADLDVTAVELCQDEIFGTDLKKYLGFYHRDITSGLSKAVDLYKYHQNRRYDEEEHKTRKQILLNNWKKVIAHNRNNLSYKMEINRFSDRTPEELRYLSATFPNPLASGTMPFPYTDAELNTMVEDLPDNYNMRLDGTISNVKNQGQCGSCWAFAVTAAVEGALARSNGGINIDLSEQFLVDCAWEFGNMGCRGGLPDLALNYIYQYGIPTEAEYGPYLEQDGKCKEQNMTRMEIKGFTRISALSVNAMKVAIYKYGPVVTSVTVTDNLLHYSSGVFYDPLCTAETDTNHAVTIVGYGVRDGVLYWVVKNSWGEDWGEDGYVLMSATDDNCLLMTEAYYVNV